jgi:hypothetical protein
VGRSKETATLVQRVKTILRHMGPLSETAAYRAGSHAAFKFDIFASAAIGLPQQVGQSRDVGGEAARRYRTGTRACRRDLVDVRSALSFNPARPDGEGRGPVTPTAPFALVRARARIVPPLLSRARSS